MTIDQAILAHESDADALAADRANPANYRPVEPPEIRSWMAKGRLRKLKAAIAVSANDAWPAETKEKFYAVQDSIETVILSIAASDSKFIVHPGSAHRMALDGIVEFGLLPAPDVAELIAIGWVGSAHTLETVAARRVELSRRAVANTATTANFASATLAQSINERHASHGDVQPVTLAAPSMPTGFEMVTGRLLPVEAD